MIRLEIGEAEFNVVLGGLIRMAQAAKASREQAMAHARKAEEAGAESVFESFMEVAAHKQTIIDQAFATLSAVGKSARENHTHLVQNTRNPNVLEYVDDQEVLEALKWAADMWSEVVGEHPILNADGTVYQRPERSE